jgi:hypothetical protein
MRWRSSVCVAAAVAMAASGACGSDPDDVSDTGAATPDAEWAAEVMPWIEQLGLQIRAQGGLGAVPFLAPDVVVDVRTIAGFATLFDGIDPAIAYFDAVSSGHDPLVARVTFSDTPYVDASGLVLPVEHDRSVLPGKSPSLPGYAVLYLDIGPMGAERYQMLPSIEWWREINQSGRTEPADTGPALTESWMSAWSGGDAAAVRALYASDAILDDEIGGVAVSGQQAIVDQWTVLPTATWSVVQRGDVPAVYLWFPRWGEPGATTPGLAVLAQLDGSGADGCPGELAVWWELDDDGLITRERRLRSVADARRCPGPVGLPSGWWTGRTPPGPSGTSAYEDLDTVTHRINEGGATVDIHNGTPSLAALVGWGLARFDLAGLRLPTVRRVTFTDFTDYCADVQGRTIRLPDQDPLSGDPVPGGWDVVLCLGDDEVYVDDRGADPSERARYVVLHELAHVWSDQYVDEQRRDRFTEWVDTPTWSDRSFEWDERGTEWAASFIAWGLMDAPMPLFELGEPPIADRFDGFQLLTGHRPLQPEQ